MSPRTAFQIPTKIGIDPGIYSPAFLQYDADTSGGITVGGEDVRQPYTGNHTLDEKIFIFTSAFMALFPHFNFTTETYTKDLEPFLLYAANVGGHEVGHALGFGHDTSSMVSIMVSDLHNRDSSSYTFISSIYPINPYDAAYATFIATKAHR